jgi:hypothetical protein
VAFEQKPKGTTMKRLFARGGALSCALIVAHPAVAGVCHILEAQGLATPFTCRGQSQIPTTGNPQVTNPPPGFGQLSTGPGAVMVECQTLPYIPPATLIIESERIEGSGGGMGAYIFLGDDPPPNSAILTSLETTHCPNESNCVWQNSAQYLDTDWWVPAGMPVNFLVNSVANGVIVAWDFTGCLTSFVPKAPPQN